MECRVPHTHRAAKARKVLVCPFFPLSAQGIICQLILYGKTMAVITICREPGSLGEEVAARVAGRLGFSLVDDARLAQLSGEMDLDEAGLRKVDEAISGEGRQIDAETEACARLLQDLIAQLAEEQDLVIIGRGAQGLFRDRPGTLHVRFIAPRKFRVLQVMTHERLSGREARG